MIIKHLKTTLKILVLTMVVMVRHWNVLCHQMHN